MKKLSIVVPCYNEEISIPIFYEEINKILKKMKQLEFEILFIDDGSLDQTLKVIKNLSLNDKRIKYISFTRNFGKEAAMYAGFVNSVGDYVVVMDADLQDPPSMLPEMFKIIKDENYSVVATRRVTREGEPPIRSFFARVFYKLINKISRIEMVDGARDYRLMTRQVVNSIISLGEYNRYSKGLFSFVGYKTKWLEYKNSKRIVGETKWSFCGLVRYALEGIISFSTAPLSIAAILGVIICIISFIFILIIIFKTLYFGDPVSGWPSMMCILLFVSGVQLLCMGIIGQYLAKTYLETKKRPIYIINEKN
mgnify:CR=1 FL=1